ncbi:microtubule-associated protein futsch-like [Branchiostoma lanceolatum]|uniref:microtubule-associated protein futsch-like n=1 Tax=Branchiostoma lanceolatum TaxID=7740 RepID=UPI00345687EE
MAMFKKRISEESSASESQWSNEQIQTAASVRPNLSEFGRKPQGSFADDVVTTSIHWVSFEDLPNKDKDAAVGENQLKWPSWKKGSAKFSKALSSSTLSDRPEADLTGRISSICRPLSAYGSVRNIDRSIVTATVAYQTDKSSVEETEHINSTEDRVTFNNDSIDSGHEGNSDEEEDDEQRDESVSSNPPNCSNSSVGESCNTPHVAECAADQTGTWQDNNQFSSNQRFGTEDIDSKCTDGIRPHHIQQVPEKMELVGFSNQQAGIAGGTGDSDKDQGNEDGVSATIFTHSNNSSSQGNDSKRQPPVECTNILHRGDSMRNNDTSGIDQTDGHVRRVSTAPAVSKSPVDATSTNCAWNETNENMTIAAVPEHDTTKSVKNPNCKSSQGTSKEAPQNDSCPNGKMNSYESREVVRSKEDNYALFAQEASTREGKKDIEPARLSPKDGGLDQSPSRYHVERRSSEDDGHLSQVESANDEDVGRHSRITQQTCSASDGEGILQETTSLEEIPSADESIHPYPQMEETSEEESEYCQCSTDGTAAHHGVQAAQSDDSPDARQIEKTNSSNDDIASMQHCMENLQNEDTSSDRRKTCTKDDDSCPTVEKEDDSLQPPAQRINDNKTRRSINSSEDLDADRHEQMFPSQMTSSSPFGSPPRLLSSGNPPKQSNSPRRRGSPRIDQIADKLLKNAVVLVERLPRSITDKASQKAKDKVETVKATGNSNQAVDAATTSSVGVAPRNISIDASIASGSSKELRQPSSAPPKKRDMKKLLPKPSEPQRYADGMYPFVPNATAIPFYPSTHGPVVQHRGQQVTMPPPPNGLQYQFAPHGAQYPLGSLQHNHDNGAHQRFYAPYPGVNPRYLPPSTATAGFRNSTYPDALQTPSNQPLQQPNPSLVVRIREVGPESILATQNRALGSQQMTNNTTPIYHLPQGAMESSAAMHQRPRFVYHPNESSSLRESRQGAMPSQGTLATDSRKPPSLIDAVIEEMYDREEPTAAQQTPAWRPSTTANRTERPVIPEVFASPQARGLKENREVKSAMNLVDRMIENAYFSSKAEVKEADVPPAKEVRPFGHSRYSPPLTVSISDGGPSVHSTPPAHPKDFMSALVARVVDEEYAKDDVVVNVPERLHRDRQLQDNGSPPCDQPSLSGPMAKPQENPTSNQKQEDERCRFANASSEQPMHDSMSLPMGDDVLSNPVDATIQDDQGREEESTREDVASDTQDIQAGQAAEIPSPRNADSEFLSEIPKLENVNTSDSSIPGSENHQRPEAILPRHVDNSTSENGHRCATDRVEPQSNPLMPSQENLNGEKCPTVTHITNNGLPIKDKNLQGNNNASTSGDNVDDSGPRKTSRDSTSNEQSFEEEFPAVSKDLTRSSPTEVGSETADQLSNLRVELAEASDLVVDEETALNHRDDALNDEVGRSRSESEVDATTAPPNEQAGSGEVRGEHTSSALTDDKSGPKRGGRPKGRKRVVEGRQKKSMTRDRDKAESSAASEARIAHEFPRHNWLMKHLMAEQQLVTNRKDSERRSTDGGEKNQTDPNEEEGEEEGEEQEKALSEVEGIAIDKDKRRRSKRGTLSRDSSMESCTSLDTLSSTEKLDGEDDSVFPCPVSPSTAAEKKSLPTLDTQEVSQPKSHFLTASIVEKSTEDSNTADNNTDSGVKDLSTESTAIKSSASTDNQEPPQTLTARHSQEEPLNLSLKAARFVDFYNSIGSKNIAKVPESKQAHAGEATTAEQVDHDTESPADNGDNDKDTKSHVVASSAPLESGLKTGPSAAASPPAERASVEQSPKPPKHLSESGSRTPITVTVHTASMTSATRQASDSTKSSSPETKPPREASAMGNVQDRPSSRSSTSMFSFEDAPKDERATRQGSHQGTGPKRPASPTVRCPPRKRSTVDSGVVCVSPYSPVSPSDKTTSQATKIQEETPKRLAKAASLPETATTTPHQFVVPSHQAVLPSKKSASQTLRSPSGQERPSVISAVPVTPPLPPRPAAPPPPPNEPPYRADQSITAALLARLEVMTKNKVNIERELVNQELLLSELRKRVVEDKSGLLRKQSQEKEALLFHMRMTYHKLCEDIDYLMRSGPPKFADGLKSLRSMAPNSTAPNSIGHSSQAIPIHRAQSDSAITLQAGGKMGGEANRWRETASNERRSSDGENSSDVQIIGQKGPTISNSLQDFRHANPHIPPYLDPRYVADARQAIVYGNTTGQQYSPAVSTVAQNHVSPRSVAPRFSPYAQAQAHAQVQAQNDLAAATAAERRRQAHMDVKRAKQILNEHKSFVEKYSRPGEGNQHNAAGNEVQLNAPAANTVIPQAPVQAGVQTSTIHPYPHGVPIHQTVTMAQVMPILPGDPSFASRSAAIAHMVGPEQRPLSAMAHQGMHPFYYINPGMPVPGYQQQPIPGQSPRMMNPVTQQLLSPPAGQQTPTSTQNHQLNTLLGAHRPPNVTSNVSINSKEPPAAQHHPVLLTGKPTPGQICHHHQQQQQYGWPGQLPTNSEMKAAYFAAHAAQYAAKVQSRAEAAMKRDAMKDHLQRAANVVALPEMQQAAYLSKHFKPFAVTAPEGNMHPSKTHPAHLQQARSQHKEHPMVGQTTREAAYLQEIQMYHANNQPASVFRGNPMMRGPPSVENGQGSPSTMGSTRRDNSGVVSIADDEYHSCVVCNKEATFLCSGCRKAWYCSPTCQVQAWEKHSEDCL